MPDWIRGLGMAGLLCLPSVRGVCQDPSVHIPTHRPGNKLLLNGVPIEAGQAVSILLPAPLFIEPIQKTAPEYTEEARLAELEGVVVLSSEIDEEGFARNLKVAQPIGLGLGACPSNARTA
jgi:hypothetical protein